MKCDVIALINDEYFTRGKAYSGKLLGEFVQVESNNGLIDVEIDDKDFNFIITNEEIPISSDQVIYEAVSKDAPTTMVKGYFVVCRGHSYILPLYDESHVEFGFDDRYFYWIEVDPKTLKQSKKE